MEASQALKFPEAYVVKSRRPWARGLFESKNMPDGIIFGEFRSEPTFHNIASRDLIACHFFGYFFVGTKK